MDNEEHMERYASISEEYRPAYAHELEMEEVLLGVHGLASEIAHVRFDDEDVAHSFVNNMVVPQMPEKMPGGILLEARGDNVKVPVLGVMQDDQFESQGLQFMGERSIHIDEPPMRGYLSSFALKPRVDEETGMFYPAIEGIINLANTGHEQLSDLISVNIIRSARVAMGDPMSTSVVRLEQLRHIEGLVASSSQPSRADTLAKLVNELYVSIDVNPNGYTELSKPAVLQGIGKIGGYMLQQAKSPAERQDILNIINTGLGLSNNYVQFETKSAFVGREVNGEHTQPNIKDDWCLLEPSKDEPVQGLLLGVTEFTAPTPVENIPASTPLFIVSIKIMPGDKQYFVYPPIANIERLRY